MTSITKTSTDAEIKIFYGRHLKEKTNADVKWFYAVGKPLCVCPRYLHKVFPNLQCLTMIGCDIEKISRDDLIGLENLEFLILSNNKLTSLPDDLFVGMKNLRRIYFNNYKLGVLGSRLIKPIEATLEYGDFRNNIGIDERFTRGSRKFSLSDLKNAADVQNSKIFEETFVGLNNLRANGEYTDFTMTFRGREVRIHKCILAAQSPVFKNDSADDLKNFSEISKYSEKSF